MKGLLAVLACLAPVAQEETLDEAQMRALIEQLGADFLEEREPARKRLEQARKSAEPLLVESLGHGDHRVRRTCLELLTILKSTAALKRASDLFQGDDDPTVRETAFRLIQALGQAGEDALIAALASPQLEYRRGAIQSLTEFRSQKCVEKVAGLYDRETEKTVKDAAWKCLLSVGRAAEPYLVKYLGDPDATVRTGALTGLMGSEDGRTFEAVAKLFVQESDEGPRQKSFEFLQRAGLRAEPTFLSGLKSAQQPTRQKSIVGLRTIKSEKAMEPVSELFLGECPAEIRSACADYLKTQGLKSEGTLIRGLDSADAAIRLMSIQTLGDIGSEQALPRISRLFREEKDKFLHEKCFDFLQRMGRRAEEDLLGALADENKEIRKRAVFALGEAQSERAIPRLIDFMTELDSGMKEASEVALASIGGKAIDEVAKAVASGRLKKPVAEAIERQYNRGEVERLLEAQLGDDDWTGFYDGQFKDLETFGRDRAVPVLVQLLDDRAVLRRTHRHKDPEKYRLAIKELSVMALGEMGGEAALPALKAFFADDVQMRRLSRRVREETMVALHRHGERKLLEDYLPEARLSAEKMVKAETVDLKEEGCEQLFALGLLYNRVKKYPETIRVYQELISVIEQFKLENARTKFLFTTYYNLACVYSLTGERAKGVEWLEKAVRAGFTDRAWIRRDGELDAIREEPGYKKLLADDRLFEKKADDGLPADK